MLRKKWQTKERSENEAGRASGLRGPVSPALPLSLHSHPDPLMGFLPLQFLSISLSADFPSDMESLYSALSSIAFSSFRRFGDGRQFLFIHRIIPHPVVVTFFIIRRQSRSACTGIYIDDFILE